MSLEFKVGHYYRAKYSYLKQEVMVVHAIRGEWLGSIMIDYQYFGSDEIKKNAYTDPAIWEEI